MTKSDLKNGMFVKTREDDWYVVVDDFLISEDGFMELKDYTNDLLLNPSEGFPEFDIMAVAASSNNHYALNFLRVKESRDNIIWERNENILDDIEKRYLRDVIRPWRNSVTTITKCALYGDYYLHISINGGDICDLPSFGPKSGMYDGMEVGKRYTLEQLGL